MYEDMRGYGGDVCGDVAYIRAYGNIHAAKP